MEIDEFKKGDYIVLLSGRYNDSAYPLNYCYKQKKNYSYLLTELDNKGGENNGWSTHPFDKSKNNDWRYATQQEIEHYNKIGKPYDVTNLKISKDDLLEEARRRYPVGTSFKSLYDGSIKTVKNGVFLENDIGPDIIDNYSVSGNYIYYEGKWAEIVSKPEEKLTIDNMVKDEVYTDGRYIFKYCDDKHNGNNIWIEPKYSRMGNNGFTMTIMFNNDTKLATQEQKDWLNHCIEKDEFISLEKFRNKHKKIIFKELSTSNKIIPAYDQQVATGLALLSNSTYRVDPYQEKLNNKYQEVELVSLNKKKKSEIKQIKLN